MIIISIIIPAYNIQDYLAECLVSITSQYIPKLEIIIINDGSSDKTGQVADSYAKKYNFIKVIHQRNQGVSVARNNGLEQAIGDYIWFIDGDDSIPNEKNNTLAEISRFIDNGTQPDIVFLNISYSNPLLTLKSDFTSNIFNRNLALDLNFLLSKRILMSHPCDKLVKRTLLLQNKIRFPPDLIVAEDYLWNVALLKNATSYAWLSTNCYLYRVGRIGSASTAMTDEKLFIIINVLYDSVLDIASSEIINKEVKRSLLLFSSAVWFHVMPEIYRSKNKKSNYLNRKLIEIMDLYEKYLVSLGMYIRGFKVFKYSTKIFGLKLGCLLYARIVCFKRKNNFF